MPGKLCSAEEIEAVFFAAMMRGYAAGTETNRTIAELPGSRMIEFQQEEFRVVDYWFVISDSNHSFGQTIIYYGRKPVWMMSYHGWYESKVIPFLRSVLLEAYVSRVSYGGRGPFERQSDDALLVYTNSVEGGNFCGFLGREEIRTIETDGCGGLMGYHHYQGMLLAKNK